MRFKWYLTEKVRKSELKDIFNDDSVLVGGEFEFFVDKLSEVGGRWDMEELSTMWRDFKMDLEGWRDRIEAEQSRLSSERSDLEDEKESLEDDISNFEEKVKELEKELEDENISKEYREDRRKRLEDEKKDIEDREQRIRDIEDRLDEIDDEEMEIFGTFEMPRAPAELRDFIYEISGGSVDLHEIDPILYLENPDRLERDLDMYEPNDEMFEVDEEEFLDRAYTVFDSTFDFDFETRMVPGEGDDFWGITVDTSVPAEEGGVELVSPPLPMPEFLDKAWEIFDFIKINGSTDSRCGFHVHMSIRGINLQEELDVVKLFLFHDEEKVYQAFKEREGSRHAYSVKQKIEDARLEPDDLRKLIDVDKLEQKLSTSKFYGINLSYLEKNHIEFRYMGGADYEDKWDAIKENAGNYAYNLKLACDPQFKRQEYITKLSRAINRFTEKWKPDYLRAAIYTFLKFEIMDKFDTNSEGVSTLINVMNRELQDTLNDTNNNLRTAFKNFKSMNYEDKQVASVAGVILRKIKSESGIHVKNDEVYNYLQDTLLNSKKLIKKLRSKFKNISRFL